MNQRSRRPGARAFSLIEVTISIGIVAFAFVAVLGMVPIGLSTFDQSVNATVQAQIAQRLFSEAQQVKFEDLTAATANGRFFDAEGFPVGEGETPPASGFVFHAVMNPPTNVFIDNTSVTTITIDIGKNRTVQQLRTAVPAEIKRFSFMVANVGT